MTELLYTHTFYEPATFAATMDDRTWSVSNGARLDCGTHFINIAKEQYSAYYDVFENVFEAMVANLVGIKTGLGPGIDILYLRDRFYVTMSPGASLRFLLPIAHMFGFLEDNFPLTWQYKDG